MIAKVLLWGALVALCSVFWFGVYSLVTPRVAECGIVPCAGSCTPAVRCAGSCLCLKHGFELVGKCVSIS